MNGQLESPRSDVRPVVAYLRLFRIPNLFTALADILMGFLVVHQGFEPVAPLVCLLAASACLYTAGMVLNDVYDIEIDRVERPQRPLPAGEINLKNAARLGYLLVGGGILLACASGTWSDGGGMAWRGGLVAVMLAASILLYDGVLKATPLAPGLMGACRLLNVLLGMSLARPGVTDSFLGGYASYQWMIAGGFGCYITGVTWFARTEARISSRWQLGGGVGIMATGLLMIAGFPRVMSAEMQAGLAMEPDVVFLLLMLLGASIIYRCLLAVGDPVPARVQLAVKHCLQSLIVLDAAVVAGIAGPRPGLIVLGLLVPMFVLGRWFRST